MRSLLKKLLFLIIPALIILSQNVFAMAEIMPLDQVKRGMSGTGYTIVESTGEIEQFDVDIVGLTDDRKGSNTMIMARASGALIDRTGGVLQGMSGSPVYINGKLVGALAASFKEMNPRTFLITPIESMMKIWDMPDKRARDRIAIISVKKPDKKTDLQTAIREFKPAEDITSADDLTPVEDNASAEENKTAEVRPSPADEDGKAVMVFSGFDTNGLNFLQRELEPFGFKNFLAAPSAGSRTKILHNATLKPGEAVGVAVVYGDFTVGATGTVTAVENNKILGFGHSFAHAGNVNYFMTDASVLGPVSGMHGSGVRMASVGNIIGRINQDREAGIAGIIGNFPTVLPITVHVKNNALNTNETYNASIAYNESLVPKFGAAIAYAALSKSADSLEESTVKVNFNIKTNVTENGLISRQNMFYNDSDVGQVAIVELLQGLNLICSNVTEQSDIYDIEVTMELDNERKTASLVSAKPDKNVAKPGDTVKFTVTIQPYRKPVETLVIPYTIPLTANEGNLTLDLHGGALVPTAQTLPQGVVLPSTESPAKEFEKRINAFINAGRSNQIVIEPTATPPAQKSEKDVKRDIENAKKAQERLEKAKKRNQKSASPSQRFDTNYIIDNVIQVNINVGH